LSGGQTSVSAVKEFAIRGMSAASPSGSPQITISPEEHISRCSSVDPDRQPADSRKTGLSVSASASPIAGHRRSMFCSATSSSWICRNSGGKVILRCVMASAIICRRRLIAFGYKYRIFSMDVTFFDHYRNTGDPYLHRPAQKLALASF